MNIREQIKEERGHLMVGLVFLIALFMILSAVAVQEFGQVLRRDNEAEMIFRAQEIVRALARYQMDRGTYPTELKMLDEPGNKDQRYIRRMYEDPLTKDGEWGLLYAGPGGGVIDPNSQESGMEQIGNERGPLQTSDRFQRNSGGIGGGSRSGLQMTDTTGSVPGGGAQEIGGLTIIGVKSLCTEKPFRVWNGLREYSEWLFTVYDLQNRKPGAGGAGKPGQDRNQNLGPGGRNRRTNPGQPPGRQPRRD